jgi:hypothetical protein
VSRGYGIIGHCSGAAFPLNQSHKVKTRNELHVQQNAWLNYSNCNSTVNQNAGYPFVDEHIYLINFSSRLRRRSMPELIGQLGPVYYAGVDKNNVSQKTGWPMNLTIRDKNHPLLRDYVNR